MIKQSVFEDELIAGMQRKLAEGDKEIAISELPQAVDYLNSAMDIFEDAGMNIQADMIVNILTKVAKMSDPRKVPNHYSRLTPEQQVKNLLDHGTQLADDGNDILNADISDEPVEISDDDFESSFEDE
jgi:hypothetical protein